MYLANVGSQLQTVIWVQLANGGSQLQTVSRMYLLQTVSYSYLESFL